MIEGDTIYQDDPEVAQLLSDFFSNAVQTLNISIPDKYKSLKFVSGDLIEKNILR